MITIAHTFVEKVQINHSKYYEIYRQEILYIKSTYFTLSNRVTDNIYVHEILDYFYSRDKIHVITFTYYLITNISNEILHFELPLHIGFHF